MADTMGKKWEAEFKRGWIKAFPSHFIYRLPDQVSGYKTTSQNPCDFIAYAKKKLLMAECKAHAGASLPFSAIRQFDKLISYIGTVDTFPGVLLWLYEKDLVLWITAEDLKYMRDVEGKKSVGIKALTDPSYNIIQIPAEKKRVFMDVNYNTLMDRLIELEERKKWLKT